MALAHFGGLFLFQKTARVSRMLEKKPQQVFYIGKKPIKHDTVAGTGLIWAGFGDSHLVPHTQAIQLMQHPDVWCNDQRFKELNPDAVTTDSEPEKPEAPGLSSVVSDVDPNLSTAKPQVGMPPLQTPQVEAGATDSQSKKVDADSDSDKDPASNQVDQRTAIIMNAIVSLDQSNPEHFSPQTGNPIINAVRDAASDQTISVKEVNAAFKALNQKG